MTKTGTFTDEITALGTVLDVLNGLDEEKRAFVYRTVGERLGITANRNSGGQGITSGDSTSTGSTEVAHDDNLGPKGFLRKKQPKTEIDRVACLAFYLTHFRDTPKFKTMDITNLNTEAAQPKLSNPSQTVGNASSQNHFLTMAGTGKKQITSLGEDIVNALPDAEAVKEVLSRSTRPKRRKKRSTRPKRRKKRSTNSKVRKARRKSTKGKN